MISTLVSQLNEFPALRLAVLIFVFVATGSMVTVVVTNKLNDIELSLTLLQRGQDDASRERAENRAAIRLNTEYRLRSEGAASRP